MLVAGNIYKHSSKARLPSWLFTLMCFSHYFYFDVSSNGHISKTVNVTLSWKGFVRKRREEIKSRDRCEGRWRSRGAQHAAASCSFNNIINWLPLLTSLLMPVCVNHSLLMSHSSASKSAEKRGGWKAIKGRVGETLEEREKKKNLNPLSRPIQQSLSK